MSAQALKVRRTSKTDGRRSASRRRARREEVLSAKALARRDAFQRADVRVFLEKGFGAATLEDVVRKPKGSRTTLYAQFGNKAGLFGAMVATLAERLLGTLEETVSTGEDVRIVLRADDRLRAGILKLEDPELSARHFLELVKGDLHVRALLDSRHTPRPEEVDRCIELGVETFLAYAQR